VTAKRPHHKQHASQDTSRAREGATRDTGHEERPRCEADDTERGEQPHVPVVTDVLMPLPTELAFCRTTCAPES
jgi:hypothetical protein